MNIDLTRLPGPHKHIALVPQWDFLELLATAAEAEPSFRLLRSTEVLAAWSARGGDRVVGVTYRDQRRKQRDARRADGGLRRPLVDGARRRSA